MARSDINKEPSGNKSSVSPKVAATYVHCLVVVPNQ